MTFFFSFFLPFSLKIHYYGNWKFSILPCLTDFVGLSPPVYMDQGNGICGLLWARLDKWCAKHSKRNGSWSDDLHAPTRSWSFQGHKLPWLGNNRSVILVLLWHRCELIVNFKFIALECVKLIRNCEFNYLINILTFIFTCGFKFPLNCEVRV
jgi:hypothetical protein